VHSEIASRIGALIVQGNIPAGSILPNEASLGDEFGVSRTGLREAMKVLASKGLVEIRRKVGTRVNAHTSWNLLDPEVLGWMFSGETIPSGLFDLIEIRMQIEPAAARFAAMRATGDDVRKICGAYQEMERATGDVALSIESDLRFHMAVLEASHNVFMRPFGALIQAALRSSFHLTSSDVNLYRSILVFHKRVLDCVAARKAKSAETAMRALLERTVGDIREQLGNIQTKQTKRGTAKRLQARS